MICDRLLLINFTVYSFWHLLFTVIAGGIRPIGHKCFNTPSVDSRSHRYLCKQNNRWVGKTNGSGRIHGRIIAPSHISMQGALHLSSEIAYNSWQQKWERDSSGFYTRLLLPQVLYQGYISKWSWYRRPACPIAEQGRIWGGLRDQPSLEMLTFFEIFSISIAWTLSFAHCAA